MNSPLLPSDVATLRAIRARPMPEGSKSITARQRKLFLEQRWITLRRAPEYLNIVCFCITEAGLHRLSLYETVTLSETFK